MDEKLKDIKEKLKENTSDDGMVVIDTTGDNMADIVILDTDDNGSPDTVIADTNNDGNYDTIAHYEEDKK